MRALELWYKYANSLVLTSKSFQIPVGYPNTMISAFVLVLSLRLEHCFLSSAKFWPFGTRCSDNSYEYSYYY